MRLFLFIYKTYSWMNLKWQTVGARTLDDCDHQTQTGLNLYFLCLTTTFPLMLFRNVLNLVPAHIVKTIQC